MHIYEIILYGAVVGTVFLFPLVWIWMLIQWITKPRDCDSCNDSV